MVLKSKTVFVISTILLLFGVVFLILNFSQNEVEETVLKACTADAMSCPDGSAVGRVGPNCEFAPCPDTPVEVNSFEDCVAAGNLVMESYPRQCRHNGQHFVEIVEELVLPTEPNIPSDLVACTMDAKQCPDGSYVGRVGPDCEFEACPTTADQEWPIRYGEDASRLEEYRLDCEQRMGVFNECGSACLPEAEVCMDVCSMICEGPADEHMPPVPLDSTFCAPPSRDVDACIEIYQPVCGQLEVQCVTEPCDPVPETFSNSCFACMNKNVISFTEGACEAGL